jgi:tetratricopeptide (TPR) repeat protein
VRRFSATGARPDAPYLGARPFLDADHDRFFGRDFDSAALLELWSDGRLTIAVGPVASGKTSLLNAGLSPLIAREGLHLLPVGRISYGATFPRASLPEHNPYTLALLQSWIPSESPTRLVDLTISDFVRRYADRRSGPIFAAIDQVDDLLAAPGPRWAFREKFLRDIADASRAEPRLRLLLIAREDAADFIAAELQAVARYDLAPLSRRGAIDAVTRPLAGTGRSFADGSAENLVTGLQTRRIVGIDGKERHITSDHVEPSLLQVTCARLWDSLPSGTVQITPRDIRVFADTDKALAEHCGQVIASVADDHDLPVARLRSWVVDTFVTEQGMLGTAYEGPAATAGLPNAVARALEDQHLLSAKPRSGSRWYELLTARLIDPLLIAADELPPATSAPDYLSDAERAFTRGEVDAADRYAQAVLRTSSDADLRLRAQVQSLLGNIATERDQPKEAESHYRSAARLFDAAHDTPAVASQLAAVGQTLVEQELLDDAVSEFRAAIDREPRDPVRQTGLARALWRLGESRAAVAVLTTVLGLDGGNSVALRARGEILAELGDAKKAMLDLSRVTLQERPSTRAARGLALARLGDRPRSNEDVDDAVAEAPRNGAVLLYAAKAKALGGYEDAAAELARRAVDATDPMLPAYHREVALQLAGHKPGNSRPKLGCGSTSAPRRGSS